MVCKKCYVFAGKPYDLYVYIYYIAILRIVQLIFHTLFTLEIDPYVKVWLMFGDRRVEKKKTPVYKCNLNPIFNATFEYDVPWEQIRDCALDVTVMDFDTVGRNELIGKLILGCK